EATDAYAICIQAGAIVAVLILYFARIKQMLRGLVGKDAAGMRLVINLVVAFLPAAIIGGLLGKKIKKYLFAPWPIVVALLVGGVAILVVTYLKKRKSPAADAPVGLSLESLTWKHAALIGLIQCMAMWPGTSRSLVTIVGGLLVGLSITAALEFSFL